VYSFNLPTPGVLSGFQSPCETFGMATCLDSQMTMGPSVSIATAADAQVAPPTIHRLTYSVGTSSLASALGAVQPMPVPMVRSRAGSINSPSSHVSSIAYPSVVESAGVCLMTRRCWDLGTHPMELCSNVSYKTVHRHGKQHALPSKTNAYLVPKR
jgi:hypothetical protein